MEDVAEVKAYSMGFLGLFCWFLIEQTIPTRDSLFVGLCLASWRTRKKTFCREKDTVLKALDSTGGATLCWPCAWWGFTAGSTNKRKSCSCATCFLPKPKFVVISFVLWSVKSEPSGNAGAATGFAVVVFLQPEGGEVLRSPGEVAFLKKQEAPLPTSLFLFVSEPNDESGANVDASKMWREDREQFNKIAKQIVQKSLGL